MLYNKLVTHSIFTEAAVTVDRSRKAEKRYEDYKKSQEARIYNHPGRDARAVLMEKLRSLRTTSHDESERLTRIVADLGSLPSHHLSDVVAYNEHNHLTEEALTVEKRKAAIDEAENSLSTKHDRVDRSLIALQARLEDMAKEKQAREIIRDLPPPVDPNETAVEEAVIVHQANVQRVTVVEVRILPSILLTHFAKSPCSPAGFFGNDHLCGVDSPQGWADPNPREVTPYHG